MPFVEKMLLALEPSFPGPVLEEVKKVLVSKEGLLVLVLVLAREPEPVLQVLALEKKGRRYC